ncbi:GAF domain-containing sensor histidine kinase [Plectonema cf. radiosum LEGE 06105]|uniref:histidine kinase n=1 Tax=Plectonema cf. radiosum LEGE 06105 TaxID=945769 RepID=A0A8J7F3P9_9CYAN|nr:GAF domain-containing sensor histidine kinase [Plectonema radiosum]MBE9212705.1 GAF domain-containing sensor histidine kinase [Plectonema cf. radiosum LEGE 06105]
MLSSPDLSFCEILASNTFSQLRELLQQMVTSAGNEAMIITEAILTPIPTPGDWQISYFTVVVSPQFSGLLIGSLPRVSTDVSYDDLCINTKLTFEPGEIIKFVETLRDLFASDSYTYQKLEKYCQIPVLNDAILQSKFTLLLLKHLTTQQNQEEVSHSSDSPSVCLHVENALEKQIAQERLLNQVITQTRKSFNLSVIITTAINQVREFLELDRLVVYKFNELELNPKNVNINNSHSSLPSLQNPSTYTGCVVHEVLANDTISSVLNYSEERCLIPSSRCWDKFRQGFTLAVSDVEKTYALEECLLKYLKKSQVKAKFAAPIVFEEKLWGLLIAHQCNGTHDWTQSQTILLTSVAEQLAIAIHQSELMESLESDKLILEQRVNDRTVELQDALVAAEAANRLRNEFLATISHELLTPLTYVIGMSATLLRWSFGELSQRQRNYLQTIHDNGERLLAMINDILEISQIEAGKAVLNITEFSLTDTVRKTIDNGLAEKAIKEQVNLKLDLQINPQKDKFTADLRRVNHILSNLLNNAIKFTPEGGSVTLRVWIEAETAVFQIEDTGIGIPEEQLSLLFEKFHQLDASYHRRYEGTGLGLALTKQLVQLHRGRIDVESTVGRGSIFTVWIPSQRLKVRG